jgi:hypothetical protein
MEADVSREGTESNALAEAKGISQAMEALARSRLAILPRSLEMNLVPESLDDQNSPSDLYIFHPSPHYQKKSLHERVRVFRTCRGLSRNC